MPPDPAGRGSGVAATRGAAVNSKVVAHHDLYDSPEHLSGPEVRKGEFRTHWNDLDSLLPLRQVLGAELA